MNRISKTTVTGQAEKFFLLLCLSLLFTPGPIVYPQLPGRDRVTDTVRCRGNASQSYALFIPLQYDDKKAWPVIFIFDPAARGKTGVAAFEDAARKYGFILACSNNSRNGPFAENFDAAEAMFNDIAARFNIDQQRIYVSGFSGGSRFAMAFAVTEKKITGIIGCGAGLPGDRNYLPSWNSGFLYYGMAGNRDMNYLEMYELNDFLNNKTRIVSYFRAFSGVHQWPPPELLTEAVEWLIFKSMKMKAIPEDRTFISNFEGKTENLINSSLSSGNMNDAIRYMKSASRDFRGTTFESRMNQMLADYEKSSEYRTAERRWTRMVADEQDSKEKYMSYLGKIINAGEVPDSALAWWKKEITILDRTRDRGTPGNSQMSSRILNFISIACSEQGTSFYRGNNFVMSAFLFEICTLSDSENPNNYFNLARSLARSGKLKNSVEALSSAISHGLSSRKMIEADPAFNSIRNEAGYKDLVGKLK